MNAGPVGRAARRDKMCDVNQRRGMKMEDIIRKFILAGETSCEYSTCVFGLNRLYTVFSEAIKAWLVTKKTVLHGILCISINIVSDLP